MSNPLELTIYPRLEKVGRIPEPGYVLGKKRSYPAYWADRLAETKHLSDAELAAEYWRSERDLTIHWYDAMASSFLTRECATLLRFATRPHYYEEQE